MGFLSNADTFEGVRLHNGMIAGQGQSGPIAGAVASIETAGQINARFTATRIALLGPFALAFKKKKDKRELYLTIEGHGFGMVLEVSPKKQQEARLFAARVNGMSRAAYHQPAWQPGY